MRVSQKHPTSVAQRAEQAMKQTAPFADKRPNAAIQAKLQQIADSSPQAQATAQMLAISESADPNRTGMPDRLKTGIEDLSGYSMDDVTVHYNSGKPAQLQAHAYAQGTDIHLAPGQEKHLPHEAWHVVQQKQGRVKPALQLKGKVNVNDDPALEHEADVMGAKALQNSTDMRPKELSAHGGQDNMIQRKIIARIRTENSGSPDLPRIISELRLEGRAPTDAEGSGQGDHTVAETLINESVRREVLGQSRKLALNNLTVLAHLTLPEAGYAELHGLFTKYWSIFDSLEGEDQNTVLEELIQRYIEIANKRPGTAFARKLEVTRGGGGERQAIGFVRTIADKLREGQNIDDSDLYEVAGNLLYLVDFKYMEERKEQYIDVIVRALQHTVLSVLIGLNTEQVRAIIEHFITGLGQRDKFPIQDATLIYKNVVGRLGIG